jgi:predicted ATPase
MEAHNHLELRSSSAVIEANRRPAFDRHRAGNNVLPAHASVFRGWALAASGQGKQAIAEMRCGMSSGMDSFTIFSPLFAGLAEVCGYNGHAGEGLNAVAEGLAPAECTGERNAEAELHRIKGELLLMRDPDDEAESRTVFAPRLTSRTARRRGFGNCARRPALRAC